MMLNLVAACGGRYLNRRQMLRLTTLPVAGLTLPDLVRLEASSRPAGSSGPARHCIFIFLCGGPSQLDMWDPKPDAPAEIRGVFRPAATNVPGIRLTELLPRLTCHADKLAIVRSMCHDSTIHDYSIAYTLLGQKPAQPRDIFIARHDHPGLGGILHKLRGDCGLLPPWVILPRPFTTASPPYKGQGAGYLGAAYDPVMLQEAKHDSLADKNLHLDSLSSPEGVGPTRFAERLRLLTQSNSSTPLAQDPAFGAQMQTYYEKAIGMLAGSSCRRAFDLTREPDKMRARYGRNEYGQSFLLARRLVEAGVRFVNVFWTFFDKSGAQFNLWDNHGVKMPIPGTGGARTGLEMITHAYCCPSFDRAFSALLEDLDQRGLLKETLVAVAGEFGRSPKINDLAGRDHWPFCYSQVLAGGGVRGGQVYGVSDKQAAYPKERPVRPEDFTATVLHAFGLEPDTQIVNAEMRPMPVSRGQPLTTLFG
jgi:hypothetical protein